MEGSACGSFSFKEEIAAAAAAVCTNSLRSIVELLEPSFKRSGCKLEAGSL
jgi:hypothetical protein